MDSGGLLDVEGAKLAEPHTLHAMLSLGFARNQLLVFDRDGNRAGALVSRRFSASLLGSFVLVRHLQLGIEFPMVLGQGGDVPMGADLPAVDANAIGDLRVAPKVEVAEAGRVGVDIAVIGGLYLPTATSTTYVGDRGITFEPALAVSRNIDALRIAANVGAKFREPIMLEDTRIGSELFARLGAAYRIDAVHLPAELDVTTSIAAPWTAASSSATRWEMLAGGDVTVGDGMTVFAAGGTGLEHGVGTPAWRMLLGMRMTWAPSHPRPPLPITETPPPPSINRDHDNDGIEDSHDGCPFEPEDRDGFDDEDGCPDPDNDADGILDTADHCPLVAGAPDRDGCPSESPEP